MKNKDFVFFFWLSTAILGQAASLQLINAGKAMHYQHYLPLEDLTRTEPLYLSLFIFQALMVIIGLIAYFKQVYRQVIQKFRAWQIFGLFVTMVGVSAAVSQNLGAFFQELIFAFIVQAVALGNFVLIVLTIPPSWLSWVKNKFNLIPVQSGKQDDVRRLDRFVLIAAIWVTVASAFLSMVTYQRHPHIPDEVAYLIQARFLADGVLKLPTPPVQEAFDFYLMQFNGAQWYPVTPIGWPALLAVGVLVGAPWLVNPVLAGLCILLTYHVIQELYSRSTARLVVLLLCFSPWYIFMGMNFMTHMFTLFCALFAVYGVIRSRHTNKIVWALAAGVSLGVMSLIRPLEGLMMAVLVGLWSIGIGGQRLRFASLAALILTTGLTASLVLPFNHAFTGNPLEFPLNTYLDQRFGVNSNAFGFGPDRGMGWPIDPNLGHSPVDGIINAQLNTFSMNIELFGWGTGSLWLAIIFILSMKFQKSDYLMLAVILAVFGVFFFYYFSGGPDFGARYWFLTIIPMTVLTARGIQVLAEKIAAPPPGMSYPFERILSGVLILCVMTLITYIPWRSVDKYYHYLEMQPGIRELQAEFQFGRSLILIRGENFPDYASAAVYNPLDFSSNAPIYAFDDDPVITKQVLEAYPDRQVWFVNGLTITGRGYEILAGPFKAQELLGGSVPIP